MEKVKKEIILNTEISKPNDKTVFEISDSNIYFVYFFLALGSVAVNLSIGTYSSIMNQIESQLNITSSFQLGIISSLFFIGQVIGKNSFYIL